MRNAHERGHGTGVDQAYLALTVLELGAGRHDAALRTARRVVDHDGVGVASLALADLIEAASRCGEMDLARRALERLSERARRPGHLGQPGCVAALGRCSTPATTLTSTPGSLSMSSSRLRWRATWHERSCCTESGCAGSGVETRKFEHEVHRAQRQAEAAEEDAEAAISVAKYFVNVAEYAVVDAALARIAADDLTTASSGATS